MKNIKVILFKKYTCTMLCKQIDSSTNLLINQSTNQPYSFLLFIFLIITNLTFAQRNSQARYEIDAKRTGVQPTDKDALPRSREFIRLDSTYYVGHMYEGIYKAEKSSDYIGFRNAIPPLRKAFHLFERDFAPQMKMIYSSPDVFFTYVNRYSDFLYIAQYLKECYDNLEMADSVIWVLDRIERYDFPKEHIISPTTTRAWTYHRNRFYTSEKFSFLKNSVAENEQAAFNICYQALDKIEANKSQNDLWFGPGQAHGDRMSVYHYLALLHAYNKNYDSSEYYYQALALSGQVSWNNYGNLKHELGELSSAYEYMSRDKYKGYDKMLREPYYFLPMMDVYGGRTKTAMELSREAIDFAGSTPGFGWYNISLARGYLYDGQLDSAEYALTKATDFKELHIGTTLTQSQYDFTINLLKLQLLDRKIAMEKFVNKGWWYSPASLYKIAGIKVEKLMLQYVLVNQLAANPERDRTVYDLFCSEATTTWDEAYYLIKDFSLNFFIRKYKDYQQDDPRMMLNRYFRLFTHQLQWAKGNEKDAYKGFRALAAEALVDTTYEKLFLGRLYHGMYRGASNAGDNDVEKFYANALYETYPQLIPFSGVKTKMKLYTSGIDDENTAAVIEQLKHANIQWVNVADGSTVIARIHFAKNGNRYEATMHCKSGNDKTIVENETMVFEKTEGAGSELALRLFAKGGAVLFETIDAGN